MRGTIENPALLERRAGWRHFLATFDDEWEPQDAAQALAAVLRYDHVTNEALTLDSGSR